MEGLKFEYSTDFWDDWDTALRKAEDYSQLGWRIIACLESDEHVRIVFVREVQ